MDYTWGKLEYEKVMKLYMEADILYATKHGVSEALLWAENFRFPSGISERDESGVKSYGGDLASYVCSLHEKEKHLRLNMDRVRRHIPETDPDFFALIKLVSGIPILTTDDFKPNNGKVNGKPMRLRNKYLMMPSVINKLVYELYKGGKVIILPTTESKKNRVTHFSALSWTPKFGKPQGRLIGDTSAPESGTPLNSAEVKELFDTSFGNIYHPTITDISRMKFEVAEEVSWESALL